MRILNLYAGIGGNRKLWGDEHDVTAVEIDPDIAAVYQQLFPNDAVVVGDAHQYLLDHYKEFDFIWSSPPCPTHSRARYGLGFHGGKVEGVYPDMRLYQEILFLKHHFKGSWVVENVQAYYKPLIPPQPIGRHWYWANFHINKIKVQPTGITSTTTTAGNKVIRATTDQLEEKLGFDMSAIKVRNKGLLLRNCVEPEVGLHIFNCRDNLKQEALQLERS
jgi:DNA (cytosine-5)-methyltransferase 1